MPAALNDHKLAVFNPVDNPIAVVNAAAPVAFPVVP
jgi:hypothetical protein